MKNVMKLIEDLDNINNKDLNVFFYLDGEIFALNKISLGETVSLESNCGENSIIKVQELLRSLRKVKKETMVKVKIDGELYDIDFVDDTITDRIDINII